MILKPCIARKQNSDPQAKVVLLPFECGLDIKGFSHRIKGGTGIISYGISKSKNVPHTSSVKCAVRFPVVI